MVKKAYGLGIDIAVGELGKQEIMGLMEACWNDLGCPGTLENPGIIRKVEGWPVQEMFYIRATRYHVPTFNNDWYLELEKCFSEKNPEARKDVSVLDLYDLPKGRAVENICT